MMRCAALLLALSISAGQGAMAQGLNDLGAFFALHSENATWLKPDRGPANWQVEVSGVIVTKRVALDGRETYSAVDMSGVPSPLCPAYWLSIAARYAQSCAVPWSNEESAAQSAAHADLMGFIAANAYPPRPASEIEAAFVRRATAALDFEGDRCAAMAVFDAVYPAQIKHARAAMALPRLVVEAQCP
ncbi:MAG: hypothetical protein AAF841_02675 [Pseudomonadota bacterium]